ncbi:MAG TPA: STAS domain-containing protein [Terriglobales bacterium]|nr:STAS domain-containing protein [Terriglobales bacterium]
MTSGRSVAVKHLPEKLSVKQGRRFFHEVEPHLQADRPRVVLDCSKIRHVDSAGIHVLLCCLEEAMKRNGDVKLAGIPRGAAAILELTGAGGLFEAFDSAADAVNSFHQFPMKPIQNAIACEYSALAASASNGLDGGRSDSREGPQSSEATTRLSGRWLRLQIAGCLMFLLVAPLAAAATSPQQQANPSRQNVYTTPAQSQDSGSGAKKVNAGPSDPETLPNSPGAVLSQTASNNQPFSGQQPSPNQQQNGTQEPVGTAAAEFIKTTGVAASKPAGAAIAPAKQKRARSILIKVGAIMGAGVAVGTVVALASSSPSRPPGAR